METNRDIFGNKIPKTAHFTGHRPEKLSGYSMEDNLVLMGRIAGEILMHVDHKGVTKFITGMALGVDMWSAILVLRLKTQYPDIKLVCAIPCKDQHKLWIQSRKDEWEEIVSKADEVIYVSDGQYTDTCMQKRNEYMSDNSDYVIAIWDGSSGGTKNCIDYAKKIKREITYIEPK